MKTKQSFVQIWLLCSALLQPFASVAQPATKVAAGNAFSLFLKADGSLWAMGGNPVGELGDGTYDSTNRPELIVASNVKAIAAGEDHSLFLKSDGSLWAMGWNKYGQLGDGTYNNTNRPELIVATNVIAIAAGEGYSLFIKADGTLWAMGNRSDGSLGDGYSSGTMNTPEQIRATNVTAIAVGGGQTLFIKSDGSLWGMGYNGDGELGDGTYYNATRPEQLVASNVTAIAAGQAFSLFLKSDGSLWAMGDDSHGQLGDGYPVGNVNKPEEIVANNVTAIACGWWHSLFLENDGSLWGMGLNFNGQLGTASFSTNAPYGTDLPVQTVAGGVTAITGGTGHSLFIKADGSLWGMGDDAFGDLGDGGGYPSYVPEQIVAGAPDYNQIFVQLLSGGKVGLSYVGMAGTNYELDRSFSLSPFNWVPQATNPAGAGGVLVFTNTPDATTDNFWRVRSVP